ncbi:hypothetical protein QTP81_04165 [Alteromonas sp. ASW11-36]|uniref:PEP-CTERM sorting domain-containing protein n=1 Tax=Alteromonas arenosi TaxID=3055817 RepID=A0ABT7SUF6_9ALTE|nr:hypothetical protein [Alteromonas sp. ASW11-36]MDM7859800.1 hypothetical protein [Alteromonas sp. ASW11-36]
MGNLKKLSALLLLGSLAAFNASASGATQYTIDFDDPNFVAPGSSHGWGKWSQVIDDEYSDGRFGGIDVSFWTSIQTGVNGFDGLDFNPSSNFSITNSGKDSNGNAASIAPYLVLFNTAYSSSDDNDLEVGVNNNDGMASNYTGGNIAIINENWADGNNERCTAYMGNDYCHDPDDRYTSSDGAPHGGWVFVNFSQPVNLHSIDLVDMENRSNQLGSFGFYDATQTLMGTQAMSPTLLNTSSSHGNGGWLTQTFNGAMNVTTLVLRMQGSGGFDNIVFSAVRRNVSEPSTIAIMLLSFGLLVFRLKRKS